MTKHDKTILVTGATGQQGGVTAHRLLAEGWGVRALVRDLDTTAARELADAGATLALGNFDEPDTLAAAMTGAYGVFVVPPAAYDTRSWDVELEFQRGARVVDAAENARLSHIVFTGIATTGNDSAGSMGKMRIENHIRHSGIPYTLLRPVRFMENYLLTGMPLNSIVDGVHRHLFPPQLPAQMIALSDIGVFAALAFGDPEAYGGTVLELAGDAVTPQESARKISAATGHPLVYRQIEYAEAQQLGDDIAQVWRQANEGHGWNADIPALRKLHPELLSFDQWLSSTGAARIKTLLER